MIYCVNCNGEVKDDEDFYKVNKLSTSAIETLTNHGCECELIADSIICKECLDFVSKECSNDEQTKETVVNKEDFEPLMEVQNKTAGAHEMGIQKSSEDNKDDADKIHGTKRKFEGDLSPEPETSDLEPDLWDEPVTYIKLVSQMPVWSSKSDMSCAEITITESKFDLTKLHTVKSVSEPFLLDKCSDAKNLEIPKNSSSEQLMNTPNETAVNETVLKKKKKRSRRGRNGEKKKRPKRRRNGGTRIGNSGLRMPKYKRPVVPVLKKNVYLNMHLHTTQKPSSDATASGQGQDQHENNECQNKVDQLSIVKIENSNTISNAAEANPKYSP